jgi:alkylation response protein AidB-like acyl-CoA dehydrogenase
MPSASEFTNVPDRADPERSRFDYIAAARAILPRLAATTNNSDGLRRLDDDAAAALRESGLARTITPRGYGGLAMSPSSHILACAELAHACSAASWVLMVCVAHDYVIGRFPERCQAEVYEGDADNLIAGTLSPQGTVTRVDGGWRLNGRWQFASGCDHSPWLLMGTRDINAGSDGPIVHHVVVPRSDIMIDDTWHTLGMRGTGSKDLVANDVFVPEHRVMVSFPMYLGLSPHASAPTYRLPIFAGLSSMVAGSVLGMAERGIKEFVDKVKTRKDVRGAPKWTNALMQRRVAESTAELTSARHLLHSICDRLDAAMAADRPPMNADDRVQIRWDAGYVVDLSRRAIDRVFAAAGAHGIYEGDPVLRVYRDINTACHHAIIDFDSVAELRGRSILTGDVDENPRATPMA